MDEKGFRQFLKKAGKKETVIDGLARQVQAFETYLLENGGSGSENQTQQALCDYIDTLEAWEIKRRMRGLGLYFAFEGNIALVRMIGEIREQCTVSFPKKPRNKDRFRKQLQRSP